MEVEPNQGVDTTNNPNKTMEEKLFVMLNLLQNEKWEKKEEIVYYVFNTYVWYERIEFDHNQKWQEPIKLEIDLSYCAQQYLLEYMRDCLPHDRQGDLLMRLDKDIVRAFFEERWLTLGSWINSYFNWAKNQGRASEYNRAIAYIILRYRVADIDQDVLYICYDFILKIRRHFSRNAKKYSVDLFVLELNSALSQMRLYYGLSGMEYMASLPWSMKAVKELIMRHGTMGIRTILSIFRNNIDNEDKYSTHRWFIRYLLNSENGHIRETMLALASRYEDKDMWTRVLPLLKKWKKIDPSMLDDVQNYYPVTYSEGVVKKYAKRFPFVLTQGQQESVKEIVDSMSWEKRMYRLLQWDVGSGKTEVAMMTMAHVVDQGKQTLMLCPTVLLAKQQFNKLQKFFGSNAKIALLTGETTKSEAEKICAGLKSWEIDILVGTNSITKHGVEMKDLALSIVDEQQKFGVEQRLSTLKNSGHLLEISATPIPRSVAQYQHGILDITSLKELPPGRKPPITTIHRRSSRNKNEEQLLQKTINKTLSKQQQVYRVCSSIKGKSNNVRQTIETAKKLFPGKRIATIHWQQEPSENQAILEKYINHEIDILISTTMIESWLDIPDAKCVIVEDAERFW
jgi:late competence protein required for DNA uptake (superfamily II DNA/RNA helicase)